MTESVPITTCYRHPDRRAGVTCQRCDRPICPSCMVQASVGFQCPECVKGAAKTSPTVRFRDIRTGSRPLVTIGLVAVNTMAMIVVGIQGKSFLTSGGKFWQDGALIGYGEVVTQNGLSFSRTAIGVAEGEWYRVVTGGFLHAGLLHLGMNMLLLYLLGAQLEPLLGRARFFTLYMACLVAGSFGVLLAQPTSLTVGASGAIFGLMGAALAAQRLAPHRVALTNIGALIVVNLLFTFAFRDSISVGAHIGGLIAGLIIGAVLIWMDTKVPSAVLGSLLCVAVTAVLFVGCLWAAGHWQNPIL